MFWATGRATFGLQTLSVTKWTSFAAAIDLRIRSSQRRAGPALARKARTSFGLRRRGLRGAELCCWRPCQCTCLGPQPHALGGLRRRGLLEDLGSSSGRHRGLRAPDPFAGNLQTAFQVIPPPLEVDDLGKLRTRALNRIGAWV